PRPPPSPPRPTDPGPVRRAARARGRSASGPAGRAAGPAGRRWAPAVPAPPPALLPPALRRLPVGPPRGSVRASERGAPGAVAGDATWGPPGRTRRAPVLPRR